MVGEAEIIFEKSSGIPYIKGSSSEAVAYGLGFSHGLDRLFQMFLKRETAYGRLSAIFGETTLGADKFIRSLQYERYVQVEYQNMELTKKRILQSYSHGVNAAHDSMRMLPFEFKYLGVNFTYWTPIDCLMVFKLHSFETSSYWQLVTLRTAIADKLGTNMTEKLLPYYEYQSFVDPVNILQDKNALREATESREIVMEVGYSSETELGTKTIEVKIPKIPRGSNAWVVSGKYTTSGKPLLAFDPHMGLGIPSYYYLASLRYPSGNEVTGATIPGVPFVVMGRNDDLSWGISSSLIESTVLYSVNISQDDRYYHLYRWKNLQVEETEIKVKGKTPVLYKLLNTDFGPVIDIPADAESHKFLELGVAVKLKGNLVLSWGGLNHNDKSFSAFLDLNQARNSLELETCLKKMDGFAASFVFATNDGDIGYRATGALLLKSYIKDIIYVQEGWKNRDFEFQPADANPHVINPECGFIVSCNNRIIYKGYGMTIPTNSRAIRATTMLKQKIQAGIPISIEFMKQMQADVKDEFAHILNPALLNIVKQHANKAFEENSADWKLIHHLAEQLKDFEGEMGGEDKKALIYNIWIEILHDMLLEGYLAESYLRTAIMDSIFSQHFLGVMIKKWEAGRELNLHACNFDNLPGSSPHCGGLVVVALKRAYNYIVSNIGKNENSWKWDYENIKEFSHLIFSNSCWKFFYHKKLTTSGNYNSLNIGGKHRPNAKSMVYYSTIMRFITSMERSKKTFMTLDLGQSEHLMNSYFDNQMENLQKFKYYEMQENPTGAVIKITP